MNYSQIIELLFQEVKALPPKGKVATYIPELAKVSGDKLGIHIHTLQGESHGVGDHQERFSIQSISKVLSLAMAFQSIGEHLWQRVRVEPSGSAFNSLVQLEHENGIPRNPLINAGALVVADVLITNLANPKEDFLNFVRKIANNPFISFDESVAKSEASHGFRNAALVNMMKSCGNIHNDVEKVLDFYFHQCSIALSCDELARTFLLFANHGILPHNQEVILSMSRTKRINAIMQTCGFYDEAGEFTFRVGLPGKSGVGGGIIAIHPGQYSIAVWSPRLNEKGNSYLGIEFLERFTTALGTSIF